MIYWKEECNQLVNSRCAVVVVDHYDEQSLPVFAVRRAVKAMGSRSGRNVYWCVVLDEPLSDGCTAVAFSYVLASMDNSAASGVVIDSVRLDRYHPAWAFTPQLEQELNWRKQSAVYGLRELTNIY